MTTGTVAPEVIPARFRRIGSVGASDIEAEAFFSDYTLGERGPDYTSDEFDISTQVLDAAMMDVGVRAWGVRIGPLWPSIAAHIADGGEVRLRGGFTRTDPIPELTRVDIRGIGVFTDGSDPSAYVINDSNVGDGLRGTVDPKDYDVSPWWQRNGTSFYGVVDAIPGVTFAYYSLQAELVPENTLQTTLLVKNIEGQYDLRRTVGTDRYIGIAPNLFVDVQYPSLPVDTWLLAGVRMPGVAADVEDTFRFYGAVEFLGYTRPGYTISESMTAAPAPAGTRRRRGIG